MRILVVEDDPSISTPLSDGLIREGFDVEVAATGAAALAAGPADLVLLDLGLPDLEGRVVCQRLRATSNVPIIVVSARGEEIDRVVLLELGADDYVVKPFSFAVLAARVKALLRRSESDHSEILRLDDLSLDTGARNARRGMRNIELTSTEFEVLRQFLLHPRRVLPKHFLMDRVWGYDVTGSSNILEVYVKQLRQKLEAAGEPRLIHTFRGAGYVLREP